MDTNNGLNGHKCNAYIELANFIYTLGTFWCLLFASKVRTAGSISVSHTEVGYFNICCWATFLYIIFFIIHQENTVCDWLISLQSWLALMLAFYWLTRVLERNRLTGVFVLSSLSWCDVMQYLVFFDCFGQLSLSVSSTSSSWWRSEMEYFHILPRWLR